MVRAGFSPSVRLFEATACGVPILSDPWPGLNNVLQPGDKVLTVESTDDVIAALELPDERRRKIGAQGLARTLAQHTADRRATQFEADLRACMAEVADSPFV